MTSRHVRIIKVVGIVARHPEFLHHSPGPDVCWHRERHDLAEVEGFKPKLDHGMCGFGGVAVAPMLKCQAPARLDAWREVRGKRWNRESHESSQRRHAGYFNRPPPEA